MKFQVIAQDRTDGSRQQLVIDAPSKAAAEKKAGELGLDVRSVKPAPEASSPPVYERETRPKGIAVKLAIVLMVLIATAYVAYRYLPAMLG